LSLFDGLTVREAAERLGLTEGSARQYLKKIFAKTGAQRQLDLIRRVGDALTSGPFADSHAGLKKVS
jgi:DNA-binding CsgD family transcriptional regulator